MKTKAAKNIFFFAFIAFEECAHIANLNKYKRILCEKKINILGSISKNVK